MTLQLRLIIFFVGFFISEVLEVIKVGPPVVAHVRCHRSRDCRFTRETTDRTTNELRK